jgi:hypothetical protein
MGFAHAKLSLINDTPAQWCFVVSNPGSFAMSARTALLSCRCGQVRGRVEDAAPRRVNRVVCYCDACQAFAQALGRPDILNANGGTDVIQIAPAALTISEGHGQVAAMRLTEKGVYRFHAACCGTPLGNTPGAAIPLIGIPAPAFEVEGQDLDAIFGPPTGAVYGEDAVGGALPGSAGVPMKILARMIRKMIGWRLRGRAWPHPFFDGMTRRPLFPVRVLPSEQRDALRRRKGTT